MCCPHDHAFVTNQDPDYEDYTSPPSCQSKEGGLHFDPVSWDQKKKKFLKTWEKNKHFLIVGQNHVPENSTLNFFSECPAGLTFAPTDLGTFRILRNGKLEGKNITNPQTIERETKIWNSENFCVVFSILPDYDSYSENDSSSSENSDIKELNDNDPYMDFDFTYMTCYEEEISWCEQFTSIFYSIALSISTVFLIITLLIYVVYINEVGPCKINPLFSKITIGFITNLTICFIFNVLMLTTKKRDERLETLACILFGYLVMYFSLAFFFWINSMSFNIWRKFTSMESPSWNDESKKFWKYFAYAQGMPLLITSITAIVDASGDSDGTPENRLYHPNMGTYACFLGAALNQSYFLRPEFIYYHIFIVFLQIANMVFLGITIYSIYRGWQTRAKLLIVSGK